MGVAAVAGFVTSGVSAIYGDAAVAGTSMTLSKTGASIIAGAAVSTLNQANDAANSGEPLRISPVKMVNDIATDGIADGLAEKIPGSGSKLTNLNETTKTAASDVISQAIDGLTEGATKPSSNPAAAPSNVSIPALKMTPAVIVNQPDAT